MVRQSNHITAARPVACLQSRSSVAGDRFQHPAAGDSHFAETALARAMVPGTAALQVALLQPVPMEVGHRERVLPDKGEATSECFWKGAQVEKR